MGVCGNLRVLLAIAQASNPEVNNAFGRVAAASLSFGQRDNAPPRRSVGGGNTSPPAADSAPDTSSVSLASARAVSPHHCTHTLPNGLELTGTGIGDDLGMRE